MRIIRFFLLFSLFPVQLLAQSDTRPNIVLIMADDHAVNAVKSRQSHLEAFSYTENIDRIGREGARFNNAFVTNSICTPSRATILTGQYSHKNDVYILGQPLDRNRETVATLLQDAGYHTAVFGKWHLLTDPAGFDEYNVLRVQGRYHNPVFNVKGFDEDVEFEGHTTDVITDMTLDYLRERASSDEPFIVMTHFKAAHDPWDAPARYHGMFEQRYIPEPPNLLDTYEYRSEAAHRTSLKFEYLNQRTYPHHHPESLDRDALRKHVYQQYIKDYLQCIAGIDDGVGKILDYLDESGLSENTVVIYTSDQGHFLGEHGFFSKRFVYEESIRIPLMIRYPKAIPAGLEIDELVINTDFAPTLLTFAGERVPASMQGRSVLGLTQGETVSDWRSSFYYRYWQHILHREVAAHYAVRTHRYKLIYYYGLPLGMTDEESTDPEWELFDLDADPLEMRNVYNDPSYATVVKELKQELMRLKVEVEDTDDRFPALVEQNESIW